MRCQRFFKHDKSSNYFSVGGEKGQEKKGEEGKEEGKKGRTGEGIKLLKRLFRSTQKAMDEKNKKRIRERKKETKFVP